MPGRGTELIIRRNKQGRRRCLMATVYVRDGEPFEKALKRFKKLCEKEGILTEIKRREYYEKPSEKRKRKAMAARKRLIKALKKRGLLPPKGKKKK